jgi:hypothetical protein
MKQIKVGLPDETREYLEGFARINGRSLSEEARARIDQSKYDDTFSAATQDLGRDVMWLAHMVTDSARWMQGEPTWSDDASIFEALKIAMDAWLDDLKQKLPLQSREGQNIDPVTLGKATATQYARHKASMEKYRTDIEGSER